MPLMQLAQSRWQGFFDAASKAIGVQTVKVEVTGLGIGDRIAADWIPLIGITHEPTDDMLTLFVEDLQHRIHHPRAIHVDESFDTIRSIEAVDGDGNHHIVQFRAALELPAPWPHALR